MTEQELQTHHRCAYLDLKAPAEDRLMNVATDVLHASVLRTFYSGAVPKRQIMREMFTSVWKSTYYPELSGQQAPADHPSFWEGPRKAAHVAGKIHLVLSKYEVIHPRQPYQLVVGGVTITGTYALLKTRLDGRPVILLEHPHRPLHYFGPTVPEMVRIVHASRAYPQWDFIPVANLPLLRGDGWIQDRIRPYVAESWIRNMWQSDRYPNPGSHCLDCKSRLCLRAN